MKCDFCQQESTYDLRGTRLCYPHAVEAFEHGADFTNDFSDIRFTAHELQLEILAEAQLTRRTIYLGRKMREKMRLKYRGELSDAQREFLKGAA